jgi:hypothetical protein
MPWRCMEGWRYSSTILIPALDGAEWSASNHYCFTPRKKGSSIHCIGGDGWISEPVWMLWRGEQSHISGGTRALESLVLHSLAQSLYWQLPCLTYLTVFMWCSTHLAIFLLSGLTFVRWFHYTDIFYRFYYSWVQSGRLMMAQSQKVRELQPPIFD